MHKLAICAIAKNEHFGLEEWVAYHRVVGVEHFYIYDNDSMVPVRQTLAKGIAAGYITCIEYPGLSKQMPAYTDCLTNFGKDNEWIAFIDCDEFLFPKQTDYVPDVLDGFINYGSLQVNWILFGSSGHIQRPQGLVIENYTKASTKDYKENLHTKAIVQPQYAIRAGGNPHHFIFQPGYIAVNEGYHHVPNAWSAIHSVEKLQLNHYTIKSLDDFIMKVNKGRADAAHLQGVKREDFDKVDSFCQSDNTDIYRFLERTKVMLNNQ